MGSDPIIGESEAVPLTWRAARRVQVFYLTRGYRKICENTRHFATSRGYLRRVTFHDTIVAILSCSSCASPFNASLHMSSSSLVASST